MILALSVLALPLDIMYRLHSFRTNSKLKGEQRQKRQGFLERTSIGLKINEKADDRRKRKLEWDGHSEADRPLWSSEACLSLIVASLSLLRVYSLLSFESGI